MNKEFIPYEQALELKELGFDEPCYYDYNFGGEITNKWAIGLVPAPLYQQAFRWFREKYDLHVSFGRLYDTAETKKYVIDTYNEICSYEVDYSGGHSTYEEAELACLKKLIEIVKNK
jgi:hypothetical protein